MLIERRTLIKSAGAAAATIGAPWIIPSRAAETLTIAAFGGEFRDIFTRRVIAPFEKKFGVKVTYDDSGMGPQYYARIRASKGSPGFDVAAEMGAQEIFLGAKENLIEKITDKEVPNLKYCWKRSSEIMPPYGIVQTYQYVSLIWNKNKIDQPTSWLDYWEAQKKYGEKIKGHVLTHAPGNFQLMSLSLIMAARAKGGSERNMEEAWKMLREIKPYIATVAATSAAAVPYLENEQIWIGSFWSARSAYYINRGLPYGVMVPKEGTALNANTSSIPIGASNKKLAFEFLNFRLEPDIQKSFCDEYFASPGRPDIQGWSETFVAQQITSEEKMAKMVGTDDQYLGEAVRDWTLKWQETMA